MLERTADILGCFTASDAQLTFSEIARRSGHASTTVHRLLGQLCDLGFVEQRDAGFRLGMRLYELGQLVPLQRTLREAARPFMEDLREVTQHAVHLAVMDGLEVVYVEILGSHSVPKLPSRVGGRMPLYCTGVGKALLAHADETVVDAVIAAGLTPRTRRTITTGGALREDLAEIRRTGISYDREEAGTHFGCVASPVFGGGPVPVAALSVTGRLPQLRLDQIRPAVRTAALGLSRVITGLEASG